MPLDYTKVKDIGQEDWDKYIKKGTTFYNRKVNTEILQEAFRFQENIGNDFHTWHWAKYGSNESWPDALNMNDALAGLGLSTAPEDWVFHHRAHDDQCEAYRVDGTEYMATGAMIEMVMNKAEGVLIVKNCISPQQKNKIDELSLRDDQLPKLQRSSDLILGLWNVTEPKDPGIGSMRYFILHGVISNESQQAIKRVLEKNGRDNIGKWGDKLTVDMSTDAGKALMGIPNAYALGYLLNQHQSQFGSRTVNKIDMFEHEANEQGNCYPVLVYHING